jgi:hypothetical protein
MAFNLVLPTNNWEHRSEIPHKLRIFPTKNGRTKKRRERGGVGVERGEKSRE